MESIGVLKKKITQLKKSAGEDIAISKVLELISNTERIKYHHALDLIDKAIPYLKSSKSFTLNSFFDSTIVHLSKFHLAYQMKKCNKAIKVFRKLGRKMALEYDDYMWNEVVRSWKLNLEYYDCLDSYINYLLKEGQLEKAKALIKDFLSYDPIQLSQRNQYFLNLSGILGHLKASKLSINGFDAISTKIQCLDQSEKLNYLESIFRSLNVLGDESSLEYLNNIINDLYQGSNEIEHINDIWDLFNLVNVLIELKDFHKAWSTLSQMNLHITQPNKFTYRYDGYYVADLMVIKKISEIQYSISVKANRGNLKHAANIFFNALTKEMDRVLSSFISGYGSGLHSFYQDKEQFKIYNEYYFDEHFEDALGLLNLTDSKMNLLSELHKLLFIDLPQWNCFALPKDHLKKIEINLVPFDIREDDLDIYNQGMEIHKRINSLDTVLIARNRAMTGIMNLQQKYFKKVGL
jgi:hypothetical protein